MICDDWRREEAGELEPAVAVRCAHHGNLDTLISQSSDTSGPFSFDRGPPFELEPEFADVGPIKVPAGLPDEQVLFLSDIFPTGYMAAEFCNIHDGDTIAIWGCGPVGQFASAAPFYWAPGE